MAAKMTLKLLHTWYKDVMQIVEPYAQMMPKPVKSIKLKVPDAAMATLEAARATCTGVCLCVCVCVHVNMCAHFVASGYIYDHMCVGVHVHVCAYV